MSPFTAFTRAAGRDPRRSALTALCLAAALASAGIAWRQSRDTVPLATPSPPATERYALPITAPLDQGDTGLCWVFATLSMLETNYMSRHPGAHVEFSRAALQRDSIADRLHRLIRGEPGGPGDGGLAVEALRLVQENGLLDRADFHEIVNVDPVFASLKQALADEASPDAKARHLDDELRAALGAKPGTTHLEGRTVSPKSLAGAALGGESWTEYDLSRDGVEGWGPSHDPEARPETRVRYVTLGTLIDLIHTSLERSEAVVAGTVDHAFLIYGADYDERGKPLAYLVKDSFAPYLYRADAEQLHQRLNDVTVALESPGPPAGTGSRTAQGDARNL